jgi:hypothetical protein
MPESGTFGSERVGRRAEDAIGVLTRDKEATMPDLLRWGLRCGVRPASATCCSAPVIGPATGPSRPAVLALTGAIGEPATRVIATVLWSAVIVLFVAGVGGFLGATDWWRPVTIAAAGLSILGTVTFWGGFASSSAIFALIADVAVLAALLVAHWPSADLVSS